MKKPFTYTGHAYHNNGSTWTGRITASNGKGSFKFISRSGYETKEKAQRYVDKWLEKLAKKCPLTGATSE